MSSFTDTDKTVSEMQQNLHLLEQLPFFAALPPKAIKLIAFAAERQQFHRDDVIFDEGEDCGAAFVIVAGSLTLVKKSGDQEHTVRHLRPKDCIGLTSLLTSQPSLFGLKAKEETRILTITRRHFGKILEQFPETAAITCKTMLQEIYQWERKNLKQSAQGWTISPGASAV